MKMVIPIAWWQIQRNILEQGENETVLVSVIAGFDSSH